MEYSNEPGDENELVKYIDYLKVKIIELLLGIYFLSILPITYDRFVAVLHPMRFIEIMTLNYYVLTKILLYPNMILLSLRYATLQHRIHLYLLIILNWIFPLMIIAICELVFTSHSDHDGYDGQSPRNTTAVCLRLFHDSTDLTYTVYLTYSAVSLIIYMIIPLILNVLGYFIIIRTLWRSPTLHSSSKDIIIRAFIIGFIFTLSWMPMLMYNVLCGVIYIRNGNMNTNEKCRFCNTIATITSLFLFLCCYFDPVIYLASPNTLARYFSSWPILSSVVQSIQRGKVRIADSFRLKDQGPQRNLEER